MKAYDLDKIKVRKIRFLKTDTISSIIYVKSERPGTYCKIVFKDETSIIVGYSLNYLYAAISKYSNSFFKVNRGVLVNQNDVSRVNLGNKSLSIHNKVFKFSRNQYKIYKNEKNIMRFVNDNIVNNNICSNPKQ